MCYHQILYGKIGFWFTHDCTAARLEECHKCLLFLVPPAPQNVTVQPVSSTKISIRWSRPPYGPDSGYSGAILGYTVLLVDLETDISYNFTNITDTNLTRNELNEYYNYSVKVAAFTAVGQGKFSPWVRTRTLEDGGYRVFMYALDSSYSNLAVNFITTVSFIQNHLLLVLLDTNSVQII